MPFACLQMLTNVRPELGGPGPLKVLPLMLEPDPARTVVRPFDFAYPPAFAEELGNRRLIVAQRVLDLDEAELVADRGQDAGRDAASGTATSRRRSCAAMTSLATRSARLPANDAQKLLLGAYFSQEFAFESAALFNPSIVPDPGDNDGGGDIALRSFAARSRRGTYFFGDLPDRHAGAPTARSPSIRPAPMPIRRSSSATRKEAARS